MSIGGHAIKLRKQLQFNQSQVIYWYMKHKETSKTREKFRERLAALFVNINAAVNQSGTHCDITAIHRRPRKPPHDLTHGKLHGYNLNELTFPGQKHCADLSLHDSHLAIIHPSEGHGSLMSYSYGSDQKVQQNNDNKPPSSEKNTSLHQPRCLDVNSDRNPNSLFY